MIRATYSATHQAAATTWIDGHTLAVVILAPIVSALIVTVANVVLARRYEAKR